MSLPQPTLHANNVMIIWARYYVQCSLNQEFVFFRVRSVPAQDDATQIVFFVVKNGHMHLQATA